MPCGPRRPTPRRGRAPWRLASPPGVGALAVLCSVVACSGDPLGPAEDAFSEARTKWRAADLSHYEFDYRLQCFCGPPAIRPVTIQVRNNEVTAVLFRDEPGQATEEELDLFPTVDDLFGRIERTLEEDPVQFEAEYDPELGHPTRVSADIAFNIVDEEFTFEITRLKPLALPYLRLAPVSARGRRGA